MHSLKIAIILIAMLWVVEAPATDQTTPSVAASSPGPASSLTPDELERLIDLTQAVGAFRKCRPSVCAYFGIPTKPLYLMSELNCIVSSSNKASFAMFSDPEPGYLFFLTMNQKQRMYVVHTDTHLKVLGAILTGNDESGVVDIVRIEDGDSALLFKTAAHAMSRCIQAFP